MGTFDIGATASGVVDSAIGQGMGLIFGGVQDRRQVKQQQRLTDIQKKAQEELSTFQQGLQLDTWNKTNYEAQMGHMKNAGLNPALMYGIGGGAGTTTGNAGSSSVAGGQAGDPNAGTGQGIQMAQQMALMKAQKENIEADTRNKNVDADKKAGVDTTKVQAETNEIGARIDNIIANTQNTDANTNLVKLKSDLAEIEKTIGMATKGNQIKNIEYNTENMLETLNQARIKTKMDYDTFNDLKEGIKLSNIGKILNNELIKSNIGVNTATIKEKTEGIMQKWKSIQQMDNQQEQQKAMQQLAQEYGLQQEAVRAIGNILSIGINRATPQNTGYGEHNW